MDDDKLIILVQENDILFDKFNKGYRLPEKKREVWSKIAKEMGVPEEHCVKRWTSLRDRYAKEKKNEKLASGSGATFVHRWHYMQQLEFLAPHICPRPVRSTINIVQNSEVQYSMPNSPIDSVPQTGTSEFLVLDSESQDLSFMSTTTPEKNSEPVKQRKNKKKRSEEVDETDEIFKEAVDTFKEFCKSKEERSKQKECDPVYAFGKMVITTLNSMSEIQKSKAMNLITEVLMKVKLEPGQNYITIL